jgi:hypothetical protein
VRLDRLSEQAAAQDLDGVLAADVAHALVADLRDELGPRADGALEQRDLGELLHQRLLAVHVLAGGERVEHHHRVVVVGHADQHRVEVVGVVLERVAEVLAGEGVRELLRDLVERLRVDVAEPGERDVGVGLHPPTPTCRMRTFSSGLRRANAPPRPLAQLESDEIARVPAATADEASN